LNGARTLVASLSIALAALSCPAWAGPAEDKQARAKFDEGITLSDAGRWAEALEAFRESDRLKPAASARYNIAATLRALGRYVEAKRVAQSILDERATLKPKGKTVQETRAMLEEINAKIAHVDLAVTPEDAEVQVDGSALERVAGERVDLDPGKHVFVVEAEGHDTTTVTREIPSGDSRLVLVAPKKAPPPPPEEEETPVYATWWLWTGVGAAVAATAAIVVVVVVTLPEDAAAPEPPPSTVGHPIPVIWRF
jgi:hypothetical protein